MKRYFVTGLLIWVPLGITLWVLALLVGTMDQTLLFLPLEWQPEVKTAFKYSISMGVVSTGYGKTLISQ